MVYLPPFGWVLWCHIGKYTNPMDAMDLLIWSPAPMRSCPVCELLWMQVGQWCWPGISCIYSTGEKKKERYETNCSCFFRPCQAELFLFLKVVFISWKKIASRKALCQDKNCQLLFAFGRLGWGVEAVKLGVKSKTFCWRFWEIKSRVCAESRIYC